jgi:hypothetical protein
VICGTRGDPGTVAPFRAWRGSRDLVAQSPKFHAPAVAPCFKRLFARLQSKSLTQRCERQQSALPLNSYQTLLFYLIGSGAQILRPVSTRSRLTNASLHLWKTIFLILQITSFD